MTTRELRNKAADYIEAHGWCRDDYEDFASQVCLIGALGQAACSDAEMGERDPLARKALDEMGFDTPESAVSWNDAPERTKEEVIARLRGAK